MTKKIMALTLVLVLAIAGSAMADVVWSGEFSAKGESKSFKIGSDDYELSAGLTLKVAGKAKSETAVDEETNNLNWEFSGGINLAAGTDGALTPSLGKYKLSLYDDYFTAYVWGNGQELNDKATYFSFISAPKAADTIRARVEVPVVDPFKVTLDFDAKNNIKAFVDGKFGQFDVGLAYNRSWSKDTAGVSAKNIVVAQAGTSVPAGSTKVDLKAAVGVDIHKDPGIAFGFSADATLTDQIKVNASVTNGNKDWHGGGPTAGTTNLKAGGSYTEKAFNASANFETTLVKADKDQNTNSITVAANYRMSDTLAYDKLFDDKEWFKNTAPAFGVSVKFAKAAGKDFGFDNITAKASAPVVKDMVWLRATATFKTKNDFTAKLDGYVTASKKLTLKPAVSYAKVDSVIDVKLVGEYKIGMSDTLLTMTIQKVMAKDGGSTTPSELISASIKVPF